MSKWFRRPSAQEDQALTLEDLVVLERFGEAETILRKRLKNNQNDVNALRKLADVLASQGNAAEAAETYAVLADRHLHDGFFDKASAVLARASKMAPTDEGIRVRLRRVEIAKQSDRIRRRAIDALQRGPDDANRGTAAVELEQVWDRLSRTEFLANTPHEQIPALLAHMTFHRFSPGQIVGIQGERGGSLILICGGEIEASLVARGQRLSIRTFSTGDILGETVLLQGSPWPADLRTPDSASALLLDREGFQKALLGNPDPRALISALRAQNNDRELERALGTIKNAESP